MRIGWLAALAVTSIVLISSPASAFASYGPAVRAPTWCSDVMPNQLRLASSPLTGNTPDLDPAGHPIAIAEGLGGYVPVLVVHGIFGTDVHDSSRNGIFSHLINLTATPDTPVAARTSLIGQLQDIPGSAVFTFDYGPWASDWITEPHIAKNLGTAIDCLYGASHQKVIIVAHSMGGLATRLALAGRGSNGSARSSEVSTVVTFGTPNQGSVTASLIAGLAINSTQQGLITAVQTGCAAIAAPSDGSMCELLRQVSSQPLGPAVTALSYHSAAIQAIPAFPKSITVDELGGNMTFDIPNGGWFRANGNLGAVSLGDSLVSTDSSMPDPTKSSQITCAYTLSAKHLTTDSLLVQSGLEAKTEAPQQPFSALVSACAHGSLTSSIELTNDALGAVADDIAARQKRFLTEGLNTITAPAMCNRPAGRFVDGSLPVANPDMNGGTYFETATAADGGASDTPLVAIGDERSNTAGLLAVVFGCGAGGVDWPNVIGLFGPDLEVLGTIDLGTIDQQEHSNVKDLAFVDGTLHVDWTTNNDVCSGASDVVPRSGDFKLDEAGAVASSNVHTGVIPPACAG